MSSGTRRTPSSPTPVINALLPLYRIRGPLYLASALVLVANLMIGTRFDAVITPQLRAIITMTAFAVLVVSTSVTFIVGSRLPDPPTRIVIAPVKGRWLGLNSPATNVPSHGLRAYGQAYAIDLVYEPVDQVRPVFGDGPTMRAAQEYPAFGRPIFAMVSGTVVQTRDGQRDHRSRSSASALAYMQLEGLVRQLGGVRFILGNHVTIRTDDGVFATVAHLGQRSVTVKPGDRVEGGQIIGTCGNSGNSSEPHVHAQLMDRAAPTLALGLPMAFARIILEPLESATVGCSTTPNRLATPDVAGTPIEGLPQNGQHMNIAVPGVST